MPKITLKRDAPFSGGFEGVYRSRTPSLVFRRKSRCRIQQAVVGHTADVLERGGF